MINLSNSNFQPRYIDMFDKLTRKLIRFLSIVGGVSTPEDIERARQRNAFLKAQRSPVQPQAGNAETTATRPPGNESVK